uniref:hypothetical protein n=1 Tax=Ferrovum myxofaciens TaxID=416213 RepID=UPI001F33F974
IHPTGTKGNDDPGGVSTKDSGTLLRMGRFLKMLLLQLLHLLRMGRFLKMLLLQLLHLLRFRVEKGQL